MFASVKELVGLPGMPGTEQGVRYSIQEVCNQRNQQTPQRKALKGFEYSIDCLPEVTQQALRERYALQLMMQKADESPAPVVTKGQTLICCS